MQRSILAGDGKGMAGRGDALNSARHRTARRYLPHNHNKSTHMFNVHVCTGLMVRSDLEMSDLEDKGWMTACSPFTSEVLRASIEYRVQPVRDHDRWP